MPKFKAGEWVLFTDSGLEIAGGAVRTRQDAEEIIKPIQIVEVHDVEIDDSPDFQEISFAKGRKPEALWREMLYDSDDVKRVKI